MANTQMLNVHLDKQLKITEFVHDHLESSFNEKSTQQLFGFYATKNSNLTSSGMCKLLLDILYVSGVQPLIICDAELSTVLRKICWKSCIGHECTLSYAEFKSFFDSQRKPFQKLLQLTQNTNTQKMLSIDICQSHSVIFKQVRSDRNAIFNFEFDNKDRDKWKQLINDLALKRSSKIFTSIPDELHICAVIVGDVDTSQNEKEITVNDLVYEVEIEPFLAQPVFPRMKGTEIYYADTIQVYINGIKDEVVCVECYSFFKMEGFIALVREKLNIPQHCTLLLVHNHLIINPQMDKKKRLNHYNIDHNSCLLALVSDGQQHGCLFTESARMDQELAYVLKLSLEEYEAKQFMDNQQEIRDKCCSMQLQNTYENIQDLDILTYELNDFCVKMSCKHGMTEETLYQYTLMQLQNKEKFVKCPHIINDQTNELCGSIWYYPEIRNILTHDAIGGDEEEEEHKYTEFEKQLALKNIMILDVMCSMNTIDAQYKIKSCEKCNTLIYKNKSFTAGSCAMCMHQFCWQCDGNKCTDKCSSNLQNEVITILRSCASKTIGKVSDVPCIRCCPQCLQLITHTTACKHVKCTACKCSFCFVCMKKKRNDKWQCGSHSDVCPVAAREIPNV